MARQIILLIVALVAIPSRAAQAQAPPAAGDAATINVKQLQDKILAKAAELLAKKRNQPVPSPDEASDAIDAAFPSTLPSASQVAAPGAVRGSTTLVDLAAFPSLIGAAFDNDLLKLEDSAFTIDLNAFAFAALAKPSILDAQSQYALRKYQILRRFAGSVTLGGKGDSFDRDGDGTADAALTAEHPGDIVTWEIKTRVAGSRDRRDHENLLTYISTWVDGKARTSGPLGQLANDLNREIANFVAENREPLHIENGLANAKAVEAFLGSASAAAKLDAIGELAKLLKQAAAAALRDIDGAPLWTVVAGGTHQRSQFGPQKWHVGLRLALSTGSVDHTVNLDRLNATGLQDQPDAKTWKAGYSASTKVLQASRLTEEGVTLSFAASVEHYQDVPTARYPTVVRSNVKVAFPLTKTASVPLAINYANHRDLLTDQNEVIANIGLAIDLSGLKKKKVDE